MHMMVYLLIPTFSLKENAAPNNHFHLTALFQSLAKGSTLILDTPPVPLTVLKKGRYRIRLGADKKVEVMVDKGERQCTDNRK
jgi:hypothetical protein